MTGQKRHGIEAFLKVGERSIIRTEKIDRTGEIEIGADCAVSRDVTILRHDHPWTKRVVRPIVDGNHPLLISRRLRIGDHVFIGEGAYIMPQVTEIPEGCVIGVGSVLTRNPDGRNQVWAGNPARFIRELQP